jgi:hypothetical protein
MAQKRLQLMEGVRLVRSTVEVESLTGRILKSGALPEDAYRDATHIALAAVHGMEVLLSWNCRQIANAAIQPRLEMVAEESGFSLPILCTPEEMVGELYEQES